MIYHLYGFSFDKIREDIRLMQLAMANYNAPREYGMRVRKTNHGKR